MKFMISSARGAIAQRADPGFSNRGGAKYVDAAHIPRHEALRPLRPEPWKL